MTYQSKSSDFKGNLSHLTQRHTHGDTPGHRHTDTSTQTQTIHTDKTQTDRQTGRQAGRQAGRHTDTQAETVTDIHAHARTHARTRTRTHTHTNDIVRRRICPARRRSRSARTLISARTLNQLGYNKSINRQ